MAGSSACHAPLPRSTENGLAKYLLDFPNNWTLEPGYYREMPQLNSPISMVYEAKNPLPWDLCDPKSMRSNFTSKSFYIVIDGVRSETVRLAAELIKKAIQEAQGGLVRGPLAQPTVRRRHMVLRDLQDGNGRGMYLTRPKRFRCVLLVQHPTSIGVSAMISLPIPKSVNLQIQPYESQFELKERL